MEINPSKGSILDGIQHTDVKVLKKHGGKSGSFVSP
jgi:hypothetical protein